MVANQITTFLTGIVAGGSVFLPTATAIFPFHFLLFFLFMFSTDFNSRNDEGPFCSGQGQKLGRKYVQFMKAIVSNIGFPITFID
jgi:hypothetical protein